MSSSASVKLRYEKCLLIWGNANADVDALITTVTRDAEFTDEFQSEIADLAPSAANLSYGDAVKMIGLVNIDAVILSVAGADGNFVA